MADLAPRGYTKKNVETRSQEGTKISTEELSADPAVEIIRFGGVPAKVSWQARGDLAGNIEFSLTGDTYFNSTAFVAGVPGSYNAHNVLSIRVTRTSGTGTLTISAV